MKEFIKKCLFFFIISFVFLVIVSNVMVAFPGISFRLTNNTWFKISMRIKQSKKIIKSDILFLGDSVANQLFPFGVKDEYLAANGLILASGHYILACNAIKKNTHIKQIYLCSTPDIIGLPFREERTYNNFVKPFYSLENIKYRSSHLKSELNRKPLSHFCIFKSVKVLPFSDVNFYDGKKWPLGVMSEISIEYLIMLRELCEQKGIKLKVVSPPVNKKRRVLSDDWKIMKQQIIVNNLEDIFQGYFDNLIILNNKCFRDGLHLKTGFLNTNKEKIIGKMLKK